MPLEPFNRREFIMLLAANAALCKRGVRQLRRCSYDYRNHSEAEGHSAEAAGRGPEPELGRIDARLEHIFALGVLDEASDVASATAQRQRSLLASA